ncbi:substrate-binding domain-containing protein [Konateibacter massiliensis]|uniref:substrate-binding domain-containing protein n=1 Tax=Konateibacter massiliensis TaxID=2002841 RepID=UPI000C15C173|nr:substrate-binding domain-containing protein [Konateibacter massiliensis]
MKKRVLGALLATAMVMSMVVGCGSTDSATTGNTDSATAENTDSTTAEKTTDEASGDQITIGFSSKTNSDMFVKAIADAAQAEADASGVKLVMADAQGDVNKQISDVETLIAQNLDVLIVIPQDVEGSAPVVSMAKEAGIPIVICNGDIADKDYTAFVGCTDQESGEILGTWFNENLEKGSKICIIEGPMGQSGQVGRYAGFEKVGMLDNFEVLSVQTANWKRDEAMALTEDWLTTYGDELKGIVCENDDMALGALSACKAAGRTDVVIGGVDGLDDAVQAVKNGEQGVSVLQDSSGQGAGAVDVAIKIVKGEDYEADTRIPFQAITKDNVDAYLTGGVEAISK